MQKCRAENSYGRPSGSVQSSMFTRSRSKRWKRPSSLVGMSFAGLRVAAAERRCNRPLDDLLRIVLWSILTMLAPADSRPVSPFCLEKPLRAFRPDERASQALRISFRRLSSLATTSTFAAASVRRTGGEVRVPLGWRGRRAVPRFSRWYFLRYPLPIAITQEAVLNLCGRIGRHDVTFVAVFLFRRLRRNCAWLERRNLQRLVNTTVRRTDGL
jgi:hypothetical protein